MTLLQASTEEKMEENSHKKCFSSHNWDVQNLVVPKSKKMPFEKDAGMSKTPRSDSKELPLAKSWAI